jgi:hypothetical protein
VKKKRIGTETTRTRIFLLVLRSSTTVNRTSVLVYVSATVSEAEEAENPFAQRWGRAIVITAGRSRASLVAIRAVLAVRTVSGGSAMGTPMVTVMMAVRTVMRMTATGSAVTTASSRDY